MANLDDEPDDYVYYGDALTPLEEGKCCSPRNRLVLDVGFLFKQSFEVEIPKYFYFHPNWIFLLVPPR